jgi:hypothetical protein
MNAIPILIIAALLIFVIVRRFFGSPVRTGALLMPAIITGYGLITLLGGGPGHSFAAIDAGWLVSEILVGVAAGLARGATIKLYVRDGHLWQRYTVVTLLVWLAMIATRIGFVYGGHAVGATLSASSAAMVAFGLSFVVESLLVTKRVAASGVPIAPDQSRRAARVPVGRR